MTLTALFEHYGITQARLVDRLSISRQYAFLLCTGQRDLGKRLGKRVAEAFDIPILELLYPEDVTTPRGPRHPPRPPATSADTPD